jgi:hypothetical protein
VRIYTKSIYFGHFAEWGTTSMDDNLILFKSSQKTTLIPSCSLDVQYFTKLYNSLVEINKEGAELEVNKFVKQIGQADDEFNNLKDYAKSLYQVSIQIHGTNGEFIASGNGDIFKEANLPDSINRIVFDNSINYRQNLNREPQNKFIIVFDAQKPNVFDFSSNPSCSTPNSSFIQVLSQTQTWVNGTYQKIISSLNGRKNSANWLHQSCAYDLLLWFIAVPFSFYNLYKINKLASFLLSDSSTVFQVALYTYFFIASIFIFRMFFNYSRWVYPSVEFLTSVKSQSQKHRLFHNTILIATIGKLLYDLFKYLYF